MLLGGRGGGLLPGGQYWHFKDLWRHTFWWCHNTVYFELCFDICTRVFNMIILFFYSNWTFIALNLPKQEDSKAQQNKKQSTKFCVQGHNRGRTPRRTPGGWFRLGWICFGVQVGFKLFSEGGQGWRGTNHIRESIPHSRSIKRKTITKLFDRFMNRGAELWNN